MKLLIDENVAAPIVGEFVARGHDVSWITRAAPGLDDEDLFRLALHEHRIVFTHDKGHGERALKQEVPGLIIVRAGGNSPMLAPSLLVTLVESRNDWAGNLAVIRGRRVRMRALPDLSR